MATTALTCQTVVERVTDYLEGALPPDERAGFDAHHAACPDCRVYVEQMRQTVRALGEQADGAISLKTRDDLLQRFRTWAESRQEPVDDREEA